MKLQIGFYLTACSILLGNMAQAQSASLPIGKPDKALISSLDSCMRTLSDSGFSGDVLVGHSGRVIIHRTYGHQGKNVDTSTAFWLASNSKQFTAAAILKLEEQGRLSIHDSITRFFKDVSEDKRGITLHHLLSHTSGLGQNYIAEGITNRDTLIHKILVAPLEKPIGVQVYSSDAYCLLAAIIEMASGTSYEQYLRTYLFAPAGMKNVGFWGFEKEIPVSIAQPHDSMTSRPFFAKMFKNGHTSANWGARGGSGIFCTATDLFLWIEALEGGRILSDSSRTLLFTPYSVIRHDANNVDVSYGYGWIVSTSGGKRLEARSSGREDWLANSFIRDFANGDVVITMAYDFGPDADAMSVVAAKQLAIILRQHTQH